MGRLEKKVAIVTGGAMGIGRAAAQALAQEGAKVLIADIDERAGAAVVGEITSAGGQAFFQRADVGVMADVEQMVAAAVERYGQLDVLVNNTGVAIGGSAAEMEELDWQRVLNINLGGVWRGMKHAIPRMIAAGGGSIVNMSSAQALVGFAGWAGYAASKGGIIALTQQAAVEYAPHNIRVNAIAPGTIQTPMNEALYAATPDPAQTLNAWASLHPLNRVGQPSEVAAAIVFLASDEASFITGAVLRVDGGLVIKG
jgi:NAD(P)-dependent dehydrogenase (short-subunit alcohol dehydrogenase family)